MTSTQHGCPIPDCTDADVIDGMVMCDRHFQMVPVSLRSALRGPHAHRAPNYQTITQAAVDAVTHAESRRTKNPLRHPVQMTLF